MNRLLPLFLLPVFLILALLVIGLVWRRRWVVVLAAAVLWTCSTPVIADRLLRATEHWAERPSVASMPTADAIVVLSSGRVIAPGPDRVFEWGDADRFFGGVDLLQAGKAPLLMFTGGASSANPNAPLEGELLTALAVRVGVPADRIVSTGRVGNTADEADAIVALLRERSALPARILLVTSAFHMPRASHLFGRVGLTVVPFPVDFGTSVRSGIGILDLIPNAIALERTHRAWREIYGQLLYRWVL